MIPDYTSHAANERTFLAWVRTGVAVIALGFVIEKFDIFLVIAAETLSPQAAQELRLRSLHGTLARHGGVALICGGVALIILSTLSFIRRTRLLADEKQHAIAEARAGLIVLVSIVLFVAALSAYLALG